MNKLYTLKYTSEQSYTDLKRDISLLKAIGDKKRLSVITYYDRDGNVYYDIYERFDKADISL